MKRWILKTNFKNCVQFPGILADLCLVAAFLCAFPLSAATAMAGNNVGAAFSAWPDTGQDTCYNNVSMMIPCPSEGGEFHGQDAQYQGPARRYTKLDFKDGQLVELPDSATLEDGWIMTRDNVTGLIWEIKANKDGNEHYNDPHDADNIYFWCDTDPTTNGGSQGACSGNGDVEDFVNSLNHNRFGGFSDWRVPTIKELMSLIDLSRTAPALNTDFFPNIKSDYYWSSTTFPDIYSAWGVNVADGFNVTERKDSYGYVRAVRGTPIHKNSFVDNHDGTITDTETGLMWQKCSIGQNYNSSEGSCNNGIAQQYLWKQALGSCEGLTFAGHDDWRLPNRNELLSIVDYSKSGPAIDTRFFVVTGGSHGNSDCCQYWSSTTFAGSASVAWGVEFYTGGDDGNLKTLFTKYVRCVRGGFSGSFTDLTVSLPRGGEVEGTVITAPEKTCRIGPCVWPYLEGTEVTLTVAADEGFVFTGWAEACAECGTSETCSIIMDADKTCTAVINPRSGSGNSGGRFFVIKAKNGKAIILPLHGSRSSTQ